MVLKEFYIDENDLVQYLGTRENKDRANLNYEFLEK